MRHVLFVCLSGIAFAQTWQAVEFQLTGNSNAFSGNTIAWADIDGDGDMDVYADSGGLWLNNITSFSNGNVLIPSFSGGPWSAAFGDYNNDGKPDLHLAMGTSGTNVVLQNVFPSAFVNVAGSLGYTDSEFCQPAYWGDYNNDGNLDIYVTHENPGEPNEFWQNSGLTWNPRFNNGGNPDPFGLADRNSHAYGLTWGDIDLDGDIDIVTSACGSNSVIPNERPYNKVYQNQVIMTDGPPADRFVNLTQDIGVVNGSEIMNGSQDYWAILFDYDGDAFPDLFIGDNSGNHRLWRNTGTNVGDFGFELVPASTHGLAGGGAFGHTAVAGDFDNDGDLDLYLTVTGIFINNGDGTFSHKTFIPNTSSFHDAAWVDFDMDGDLDLVNQNDLYLNPGNNNHWLAIELVGDPSKGTTRSANNVKIKVTSANKTQYREHRYLVGTYSQNMLPTHFGLGPDKTATVEVTWPNQTTTVLNNVTANQYLSIAQTANCGGSLSSNTPAILTSCSGESFPLSIQSSSGNPIEWRVKSGPHHAPTQFSDRHAMAPVFTPQSPGQYILVASYAGCMETGVEVTVMSLLTENWADTGPYAVDMNNNHRTDILELMDICLFPPE
ncbi:MAG: CRTAC1 family protein [Acidobacteria bacterium]|nr:CRTAC1 family protein [Acidobacteriota bacterium]